LYPEVKENVFPKFHESPSKNYGKTMNSRIEILSRLRERRKSQKEDQLPEWKDRDHFADYPQFSDSLLKSFDNQLHKLSGILHIANSNEDAATILFNILATFDPKECRAHQSPLIENFKNQNTELEKYLPIIDNENISSEEFAKIQVGITEADYLIARTGSVLLRTTSAGGRRLSVLPPTHIVIAEQKQLLPSLDDALHLLDKEGDYWSYATIITGPSRTSDIEKQLVLGAHGPKRLIVILIKG
jgi:L-lactate dehydrogenase complex protein LldG